MAGNRVGLRYRPDIDGLRALAVLSVILYHSGLCLPGGFVGVDVFFVISGFLITSLLLKEGESGPISLKNFWIRRIRRLYPALVVFILCVALVSWTLLLPVDLVDLGRSSISQALLVSNFYFWRTTDYFGGGAETKPLLHTWSLAIEEQFYLFLPLFLAFLLRSSPKRARQILEVCLVVSFLLCVLQTPTRPAAAFYLLPTRAWELLLGAVLAFRSGGVLSSVSGNILSAAGLVLIIVPVITYDHLTVFPGVAALPPCLGCLMIIKANSRQCSRVGDWLGWEPLRQVGLASYSLYLWHWPVLTWANYYHRLDSVTDRLLAVGVGLFLGAVSYLVVEKRTRHASFLKSGKYAFLLVFLGSAAMLGFGLVVDGSKGYPERLPPEAIRYLNTSRDLGSYALEVSFDRVKERDFERIGDESPTFFLWGDSQAHQLLPALAAVSEEKALGGLAAFYPMTPPVTGFYYPGNYGLGTAALSYNDSVVNYILEQKIGTVVMAAAWRDYIGAPGFEEALEGTVHQLSENGVTVYVVRQIPGHPTDLPRSLALVEWKGLSREGLVLDRAGFLNQREATSRLWERLGEDAILLDPLEIFFPSNQHQCLVVKDNELLFRDGWHLSVKGSLMMVPLFERLGG